MDGQANDKALQKFAGTEPIENPVNFVAYWSEGSESLYTL